MSITGSMTLTPSTVSPGGTSRVAIVFSNGSAQDVDVLAVGPLEDFPPTSSPIGLTRERLRITVPAGGQITVGYDISMAVPDPSQPYELSVGAQFYTSDGAVQRTFATLNVAP